MGRKGWRQRRSVPAYFIVSKETGKLSYFWKHAYTTPKSANSRDCITNPDTGRIVSKEDGGHLLRGDFEDVKHFEVIEHKGGTESMREKALQRTDLPRPLVYARMLKKVHITDEMQL